MLPELGVLYRDHAATVWRYARTRLPSDADAEDVTSDVFARAMRSHRTYDSSKGSPRAWLLGIARFATADFWRYREPEDPHDSVPEGSTGDEPLLDIVRAEGIGDVRLMLDTLSDREREALSLRFGAELSSAEIGDLLAISPTAARMLIHRAITKLRGVMADG